MQFYKSPFLKRQFTCLQLVNHKPFYLAFLRVAISTWLLKEVAINWSGMEMLYGKSRFIVVAVNDTGALQQFSTFTRYHYSWFITTYVFFILLNIAGIGRWLTSLSVFILLYILQGLNPTILNGGDLMARQIVFFLIFADAWQYFVFIQQQENESGLSKLKMLTSNLAAISIMLQLCLAYFASFLAKIKEPLWLHGEATYYAFSNERFLGTSFNVWIVQHRWIDYLSNYGTLLFELAFPLLIWFKKLRPSLLTIGIIFHLSIYIFMMIYGFEIVFILIYGLFLPNDFLLTYATKIKIFFVGNNRFLNRYMGIDDGATKAGK